MKEGLKVRCNKAYTDPACLNCNHASPHAPLSIRRHTGIDMPCNEYRDYCFDIDEWIKCRPEPPRAAFDDIDIEDILAM